MSDLIAGIYRIRNLKNGKFYIGSTGDFKDRWEWGHFYDLDRRDHPNSHLQNAYNLDGRENFVFEILVFLDPETQILESIEQLFLDYYKIPNNEIAYNKNPTARRPPKFADLDPETQTRVRQTHIETGRRSAELKLGFHAMSREEKQALGRRNYDRGIGLAGMTKKQRRTNSRKIGRRAVDLKLGFHAMTTEQRRAHSRRIAELKLGFHAMSREEKAAAGRKGRHIRWHINRGIVNPDCLLCQAETE